MYSPHSKGGVEFYLHVCMYLASALHFLDLNSPERRGAHWFRGVLGGFLHPKLHTSTPHFHHPSIFLATVTFSPTVPYLAGSFGAAGVQAGRAPARL